MSAICNLYAGDIEFPSWIKGANIREKSIYESNYLIPIFWSALFSEKNLAIWLDPDGNSEDIDDNRVPVLLGIERNVLGHFKTEHKH